MPPIARAGEPISADVQERYGEADARYQEAQRLEVTAPAEAAAGYVAAAELLIEAAAMIEEADGAAGDSRDDFLYYIVEAYRRAHRLTADRKHLVRAREQVQIHLDALAAAYGDAAETRAAYTRARRYRDELAADIGDSQSEPESEPMEVGSPSPPAAEGPTLGPEPPGGVPPADRPGMPERRLRVGLWSSVGITAAAGVAAVGLAIPLTRTDNFQGSAYRKIFDASSDLKKYDPEINLCDPGSHQGDPEVTDACDAHLRLRVGFGISTAIAGAAAISTIVHAVLLTQLRGRTSERRGRVRVGAGPTAAGGYMGMQVRF